MHISLHISTSINLRSETKQPKCNAFVAQSAHVNNMAAWEGACGSFLVGVALNEGWRKEGEGGWRKEGEGWGSAPNRICLQNSFVFSHPPSPLSTLFGSQTSSTKQLQCLHQHGNHGRRKGGTTNRQWHGGGCIQSIASTASFCISSCIESQWHGGG